MQLANIPDIRVMSEVMKRESTEILIFIDLYIFNYKPLGNEVIN